MSRDAALAQVSTKWIDIAVNEFDRVVPHLPHIFTGEDIRLALTEAGLQAPHHHNAWGAFTMKLVRSRRIVGTNNFAHMKTPKSHSRMTRLYVRGS